MASPHNNSNEISSEDEAQPEVGMVSKTSHAMIPFGTTWVITSENQFLPGQPIHLPHHLLGQIQGHWPFNPMENPDAQKTFVLPHGILALIQGVAEHALEIVGAADHLLANGVVQHNVEPLCQFLNGLIRDLNIVAWDCDVIFVELGNTGAHGACMLRVLFDLREVVPIVGGGGFGGGAEAINHYIQNAPEPASLWLATVLARAAMRIAYLADPETGGMGQLRMGLNNGWTDHSFVLGPEHPTPAQIATVNELIDVANFQLANPEDEDDEDFVPGGRRGRGRGRGRGPGGRGGRVGQGHGIGRGHGRGRANLNFLTWDLDIN